MLSGNFAKMMTSTPFRDLLHAANLRHGTNLIKLITTNFFYENTFYVNHREVLNNTGILIAPLNKTVCPMS
jgi:hypothetical protein